MDPTYLMLTGSLSGLLSVLAHSVVASAVDAARGVSQRVAPAAALPIPEALLHMLCGAGLGLLFWLSWGLPAVVDVPWWVRGAFFGGLCWLAFALPSVIAEAMAHGTPRGVTAVAAARWATTCLVAALACAWSWERSGWG